MWQTHMHTQSISKQQHIDNQGKTKHMQNYVKAMQNISNSVILRIKLHRSIVTVLGEIEETMWQKRSSMKTWAIAWQYEIMTSGSKV